MDACLRRGHQPARPNLPPSPETMASQACLERRALDPGFRARRHPDQAPLRADLMGQQRTDLTGQAGGWINVGRRNRASGRIRRPLPHAQSRNPRAMRGQSVPSPPPPPPPLRSVRPIIPIAGAPWSPSLPPRTSWSTSSLPRRRRRRGTQGSSSSVQLEKLLREAAQYESPEESAAHEEVLRYLQMSWRWRQEVLCGEKVHLLALAGDNPARLNPCLNVSLLER